MVRSCYHCGNEAEYTDIPCEFGQGLPHCKDCVSVCDLCEDVYCGHLYTDEDGLHLCEVCQEKEKIAQDKLIEEVISSVDVEGYWYTGQKNGDGETILEYISSDSPKISVHIEKRSA